MCKQESVINGIITVMDHNARVNNKFMAKQFRFNKLALAIMIIEGIYIVKLNAERNKELKKLKGE